MGDATDVRGYANCGRDRAGPTSRQPPVAADVNGDGNSQRIVLGNASDVDTLHRPQPHAVPPQARPHARRPRLRLDGPTADPEGGTGGRARRTYTVVETADHDGDGLRETLFSAVLHLTCSFE